MIYLRGQLPPKCDPSCLLWRKLCRARQDEGLCLVYVRLRTNISGMEVVTEVTPALPYTTENPFGRGHEH